MPSNPRFVQLRKPCRKPINPQVLERKLQALFDNRKAFLQRALGEDNAEDLLTHVRNAHDAVDHINDFQEASETFPATGQQGLRDLIARNTKSTAPLTRFGRTVARTDWGKVLNDSEQMGDQEKTVAFGQSAEDLHHYLGAQA